MRIILHPNHEPRLERLPESVQRLDATLNQKIAESTSDATVNRWLATKRDIKIRLADLPPNQIDAAARAALQHLEGDHAA